MALLRLQSRSFQRVFLCAASRSFSSTRLNAASGIYIQRPSACVHTVEEAIYQKAMTTLSGQRFQRTTFKTPCPVFRSRRRLAMLSSYS
eukprot:1603185-Rhodomonas_salina.2